jgi:hypothetical protein
MAPLENVENVVVVATTSALNITDCPNQSDFESLWLEIRRCQQMEKALEIELNELNDEFTAAIAALRSEIAPRSEIAACSAALRIRQ